MAPTHFIIADDCRDVRQMLRRALEADGRMRCSDEACDGVELLVLVEAGEVPEVLLLDLSMPRMDGWELLRRTRLLLPDTRIIVYTGHAHMEEQVLAAGADAFVPKGSRLEQLREAVGPC